MRREMLAGVLLALLASTATGVLVPVLQARQLPAQASILRMPEATAMQSPPVVVSSPTQGGATSIAQAPRVVTATPIRVPTATTTAWSVRTPTPTPSPVADRTPPVGASATLPSAAPTATAVVASGVVKGTTAALANVRADPSRRQAPTSVLRGGTRVDLIDVVRGEVVETGEAHWWHVR